MSNSEVSPAAVAVVTGANSGIGRATALHLAEYGYAVYGTVRSVDRAGKLLADAEARGLTIELAELDIASGESVHNGFSDILDRAGRIDHLINNAGVGGNGAVEETSAKRYLDVMNIDLCGATRCIQAVLPGMRERGSGTIVNITSVAGRLAAVAQAPYVAAKWAAAGFTETLAMELGPDNIRVNGIVPGSVNGDRMERVIAAHAGAEGLDPEAVRHMYAIGTSMQCYVDPQEISDLIMFLVSDYGRHISGQIIGVDGNTETLYPRS